MSLKRTIQLISITLLFTSTSFAVDKTTFEKNLLNKEAVADALGWIPTNTNRCGGYYVEPSFSYPIRLVKTNAIQITSDQMLFAQHGTSIGSGKVTITRHGQQIVANKAWVYRDPTTGELNAIELSDNVTLREPNSLVLASFGRFVIKTKAETLHDILYRTAIYADPHFKAALPSYEDMQKEHKIYQLSAWGIAKDFSQETQRIFEFEQASYSTCPPVNMAWQVKTSHLTLNKETGRGTAKNARLLVRGVPILYTPYFSFPIDNRRKTGFLWPIFGNKNNLGPSLATPFYWNLAPNFDTTITPNYLSKRGLMINDEFRYLSPANVGSFNISILPEDRLFHEFRIAQLDDPPTPGVPLDVYQSELRRLKQASTTRKAFSWSDVTRLNDHWSGNVNYNWVSDDYYLKDLSSNVNQVTQNQLLQQGEINYKGLNWNFTGRVQGYQTLHPADEPVQFSNQYTRLPQLVLAADYPDMPGGFEYFVSNDLTRFDIRKNPGVDFKYPRGDRLHFQPGISRPFNWTFLTFSPRVQLAMTKYTLGDVMNSDPKNPSRVLPIFDLNTGLYFDRNIGFAHKSFRQTLEPQVYYTYIPYKNQNQLPVFDTTVNTLTFDQLFTYNRFSGLDRINDANQVAVGLTTRFIDQQTGLEKIKAAVGQILYFRKRLVTLCSVNDPLCPPGANDTPLTPANRTNRSPLSGLFNYKVNPDWSVNANSIWNSKTYKLDNQSIALNYAPITTGRPKLVNLGYNYVRGGDSLPMDPPFSNESNLSSTDFSFTWPVFRDWSALGRWTQNWNHHHFQNLLYGFQYDSCCWAIRMAAGRIFTGLSPAGQAFQYTTQFYFQIALKGLGDVGQGDPALSTSIGYQNNFGRDF